MAEGNGEMIATLLPYGSNNTKDMLRKGRSLIDGNLLGTGQLRVLASDAVDAELRAAHTAVWFEDKLVRKGVKSHDEGEEAERK